MNNELIDNIIIAIAAAVITSDTFKAAVKQAIDARVEEFNDEDDNLLESDEFKKAVDDVIDDYDFDDKVKIDEDKIKEVVRGMDFTVEVGGY